MVENESQKHRLKVVPITESGSVLKPIRDLFDRIFLRLKYNMVTVAVYFRKQGATIGEDCLFSSYQLASEPYLVTIGNHVFIAHGALLHTHDGAAWIARENAPDLGVYGRIVIEDNCIIGAYSQILPGVHVGKNSVVGAGSVVITDVPPDSIVSGVPARVIGSSSMYRKKCAEKWKIQEPPGFAILSAKEKNKALRKHLLEIL
jgi:acetyltransferase-like isoleucine patch superfamily enzyme